MCPSQGSIEMEVLLNSTGFNVLPLNWKDRALSGNTIDTLTTHTQNHLTSKMSPVGLVLFKKNSSVDWLHRLMPALVLYSQVNMCCYTCQIVNNAIIFLIIFRIWLFHSSLRRPMEWKNKYLFSLINQSQIPNRFVVLPQRYIFTWIPVVWMKQSPLGRGPIGKTSLFHFHIHPYRWVKTWFS